MIYINYVVFVQWPSKRELDTLVSSDVIGSDKFPSLDIAVSDRFPPSDIIGSFRRNPMLSDVGSCRKSRDIAGFRQWAIRWDPTVVYYRKDQGSYRILWDEFDLGMFRLVKIVLICLNRKKWFCFTRLFLDKEEE